MTRLEMKKLVGTVVLTAALSSYVYYRGYTDGQEDSQKIVQDLTKRSDMLNACAQKLGEMRDRCDIRQERKGIIDDRKAIEL